MYFARKLKPNWDITGLLPGIFLYVVCIMVWIQAGIQIAIRIVGYGLAVYAIFTVYIFVRTRSHDSFVRMLHMCSLALFVIILPVTYLFESGELPVVSRLLGFIPMMLLAWVCFPDPGSCHGSDPYHNELKFPAYLMV